MVLVVGLAGQTYAVLNPENQQLFRISRVRFDENHFLGYQHHVRPGENVENIDSKLDIRQPAEGEYGETGYRCFSSTSS
jgi:hypothetical protein